MLLELIEKVELETKQINHNFLVINDSDEVRLEKCVFQHDNYQGWKDWFDKTIVKDNDKEMVDLATKHI